VSKVDTRSLPLVGLTLGPEGLGFSTSSDAATSPWARSESAREMGEALRRGARETARAAVCRDDVNFGYWILGWVGATANVGAAYGSRFGTTFALAEHGSWLIRVGGLSEGVLGGGLAGASIGAAVGVGLAVGTYVVYELLPVCN
jgi:hypothetical protein